MNEILSKKSLIQVFNQLREGVIVYSLDFKIVYFNESAKHLGFNKEVIGQSIFDVYKSVKYEDSTIVKVKNSKKEFTDKVHEFVTINGKRQITLCSTYPLYSDEKMIGVYEIFEDVSKVLFLNKKLISIQKKYLPNEYKSKEIKPYTVDSIIGESKQIKELKGLIPVLSKSKSSILIFGETGTGKELIVQAIHSFNENSPFIAQNCAAIPESLLEGILFGTVKGGFTGAEDRVGLFELAHNGTLFLDELNSMSLSLQAKLLRVIQEKKVRRVGDNKEISVNVRLIASTNVDPSILLQENKIREDLYYRINVIPLHIPPLRERKEDISLLISEFIKNLNQEFNKNVVSVDNDVLDYLFDYDWPGNVRELRNLIERAMNVVEGDTIKKHHLQLNIPNIVHYHTDMTKNTKLEAVKQHKSLKSYLDNVEKEIISEYLIEYNGNISKVARKLNVPQQSMSRKIKKYNLYPIIYDVKQLKKE